MADQDLKPQGIIAMILEGMHPTVKAILFACLAVPVFFALSGMMLQVNVGALIQKKLDQQSEQQSATLDERNIELLASLEGVIADIVDRLSEVELKVAEAEGRGASLELAIRDLKDALSETDQGLASLVDAVTADDAFMVTLAERVAKNETTLALVAQAVSDNADWPEARLQLESLSAWACEHDPAICTQGE